MQLQHQDATPIGLYDADVYDAHEELCDESQCNASANHAHDAEHDESGGERKTRKTDEDEEDMERSLVLSRL